MSVQKLCGIEGCEKHLHARNLCQMHYVRLLRHGDPHAKLTGQGTVDRQGYRQVQDSSRKGSGRTQVREHRKVMERKLGRRLLRSEEVHHKDRNTLNNDPDNLEVLSHADHQRLHREQRTHCKRGHLYSEDNVILNERGHRTCRTCLRLVNRESYARRKAHQEVTERGQK